MAVAGYANSNVVDGRRLLAVSFAAAVGIHLLSFGVWAVASTLLLGLHQSTLAALDKLQAERTRQAQQEPPLLFVEVLPEQAAPAPPAKPQFYSAANSLAANPDATVDTQTPKADGKQEKVARTFDNLQPDLGPPQPAAPPVEPQAAAEPPKPEPKPAPNPGDLALIKPEPTVTPTPKPERPRTLVEARSRQGAMAGQTMKQDSGVSRRGRLALDVTATSFGAYDGALIAAVQKRWYDLLEESQVPMRTGAVMVEFRLHDDGQVTGLKVVREDVGEILSLYCRKAIGDPAPYPRWPTDMRRMIGRDYRDIKFTFYYL